MLVSLPLIPSRISCWNGRPLDVGAGELARAAGVLAGAGEGDRLEAVEVVLALLEVELEGAAGDARADRGRQVDVDAADRVDELAEAVEVDDRDLVDVDAEQVLDRPDRELRAAGGVGGVDLLRSLPGDLGERVAGDRELAERAPPGPDQHDRVRAVGRRACSCRRLGPAAGDRLDAVLGLGLVGPREGARAHVGAEDEDRLRADEHERVAVERASPTPSASFPFWICAEIAKASRLSRIQPSANDPDPLQRPCATRAARRRAPSAPSAGLPERRRESLLAQAREVGLADAVAQARARLVDRVLGRFGPLGWPVGLIGSSAIGYQYLMPHGESFRPIPRDVPVSVAIGVDLGGTKMAVGVVDDAGDVLYRAPRPPPAAAPRTLLARARGASCERRSRPIPDVECDRPRHAVARSTATRGVADQLGQPADRRRADPRPDRRAPRPADRSSTTTPTPPRSPSTASAPPAAPATWSCSRSAPASAAA